MNYQIQHAEWTPETIRRFWNYTSQKKYLESEYFSFQVGKAIVHLLQRANILKANRQVLDFGCGPGFLLERFLKANSYCYGFDFSDESVKKVNERFCSHANWRGAVSSITLPIPLNDEVFDIVTCIETLEHLLDEMIPLTLAEIARLLKKDGVALFTTPYNEDIAAKSIYCPFCDQRFHPVQHVRSFDEKSLSTLLTNHGFEVLYCRNIDLFALQKPGRISRTTIKTACHGWFHRFCDAVSPVKFAGTEYRLPRIVPGPNLCAFVRKRSS